MKILLKTLKILGVITTLLFIVLYCLFTYYTAPKSDKKILEAYKASIIKPLLSKETYKGFEYRKISILKDTTLPTLVFVHGTIGSINDFNKYLADTTLQQKTNMIAYDRIGYNYKDKNKVQESIAFEKNMLESVLKKLPAEKTILIGYSYGGPIALALKKKIKKTILLAPAVYSEAEPMPWLLNIYNWKATRWMVPKIWKKASKEKLSHKSDLQKFEANWKSNPNEIVSIHGSKDWIVPFSNSLFLQEQFPKEQFTLIKIEDVGHELVWTEFDFIKQQLLNELD